MSLLDIVRNNILITTLRSLIPDHVVNTCFHLPKALLANFFYSFPSKKLSVIGVTGTDGKTTTATMLYHILHESGFKVALISTVAAKIGDKEIDTGFHVTSPDSFSLQRLLKEVADNGLTHVVLETTSHGLAQHRLWGVTFTGGILTNITEDHVDYHKTMPEYAAAKAKLFKQVTFAVLNREDDYFDFFNQRVHKSAKIITYGKKLGEFNLNHIQIKLRVWGEYNRLNALAALAAAHELGVDKKTALIALTRFQGVRGRMQIMKDKPFTVIVDFAHTPNALKQALTSLRKNLEKKGRLISIFGCAGLRDKNRRKMGLESAQLADITIITAEDPRTEGVEAISQDIAQWAEKGGAHASTQSDIHHAKDLKFPVYVKIPDRSDAIRFAILNAKSNDIIGIFGKGHEQSMCFGTTEFPWTDQAAVKEALKRA